MPIREFARLRNRTAAPVSFTFDGQGVTIPPRGDRTVDLDTAKWLFTREVIRGVSAEGTPVFTLGIEDGGQELMGDLEDACWECSEITLAAPPESPGIHALRGDRPVQMQRVDVDARDFHPDFSGAR